MQQLNNITGIILAGGQSSRMGTDKGLLSLNGLLFIERIIKALKPLVDEIIIVSNNSIYDQFGFKRVTDSIQNAGPLAGLYSGLQQTTTKNNLVLSCDVPLINTEVLNVLVNNIDDNFQVIQLKSQNKTMPLIALYNKECMYICLELLQQGERRLRNAVNQLHTKTITIDAKFDTCVNNINTKDELNALRNDIKG
ncbi:hypothetical protein A9Q87_11705 [Flavobacteriales bacterium 34_180_T64]|nr:hypothetical protein A9Q87_11705 [Flavobacteriales bacterium 34_180_T64]